MAWGSKLVDLAMSDQEKEDAGMVAVSDGPGSGPRYPFGMTLSFDKATLEKVGLGTDVNVGDLLDARIFGTVTSISKHQRNDGTDSCCVCVQVEKMSVENEMKEKP